MVFYSRARGGRGHGANGAKGLFLDSVPTHMERPGIFSQPGSVGRMNLTKSNENATTSRRAVRHFKKFFLWTS